MPILKQKEKFKKFISEVWESLKFGEAKYGADTFDKFDDQEFYDNVIDMLMRYKTERKWKRYLAAAVGYIFLWGLKEKKWK